MIVPDGQMTLGLDDAPVSVVGLPEVELPDWLSGGGNAVPEPQVPVGIIRWQLAAGQRCGKCGAPDTGRLHYRWQGLDISVCPCCANDGFQRVMAHGLE